LRYNRDLLDADSVARMAGHLESLLEGILANPKQEIAQLPILTASERQKLLVQWNDTQRDYDLSCCLSELFEAQVERTPEAIAVTFEQQQLTYRELNARANQLGHYLQTLGVAPGVLVGICVERSLDMLIALLAILKAGAAYIPLDPAYPQQRLEFMLADSQASVLLTQNKLLDIPKHNASVVCLDSDWEQISVHPQHNFTSSVQPHDLAYIIYTSGSTGQPKGVAIEHRSVVNFLIAMQQQLGCKAGDTLLSVTTISFDIAVLELFLPLAVGAKVVLVSREVATDGRQLLQQLSNSHATFMQATPATWQMLLAASWQGSPQLTILCGGEALPRALAQQLRERGTLVWNQYGPTETTIWSTIHQVDEREGAVPIGRAIANTKVYILDSHLQPVPIGVAGELYIGGVGVARGYLNRPETTAERFMTNPFREDERLYRTGDLARYLPDGNIEYIGRIDHQVKIRGFRIELGEIENAIKLTLPIPHSLPHPEPLPACEEGKSRFRTQILLILNF
jgi:amino acid adenylation domain-containing protein